MPHSTHCAFCGASFDAPAAVCPHCGGPVADAGLGRVDREVPFVPSNDDALELPDVDGDLEILPVGAGDASLFAPPAPKPPARPRPPLPKRIARA